MFRCLVILLGCASWALSASAIADETPASPADSALWGVYSQLVGTSRQAGGNGYRLTWSWSRPGEEILEQWSPPGTSTISHAFAITLGANPGQLVFSASGFSGGTWDGTIQPDGAVLYIGRGLMKAIHHISLAEDGYLENRRAKVKNGKIVSLADAGRYSRYALVEASSETKMASSTTPSPVAGSVNTVAAAISAPVDPLADVAVWGDYARIVGRDWRGYYDISVRWSAPGSEIIEVWKYGPMTPAREGQTLRTIKIRPGSKPGRLTATITGSRMEGTRDGKIGKSGEVSFGTYSFKLIDAETVEHWGATFASNYSYKVFAVPSEVTTPQRSTWGTYVDIAGQSFRSDTGSMPLLLSFGWLIPGKVLYELRHYLDDDMLHAAFIHASPEDGSLILRWSPPYNGDSYGEVDATGKVNFISKRTLGMRSQHSVEQLSSGQLQFMTDFSLDPKRTWTLSAVPSDQVSQIRMAAQREKQQRDRAEAVAKAGRSQRRAEFFGSVLGAAETFSQELSIAQARGGSSDAQLGEATGRTLDQLRMQQQNAAIAQQFQDSSAGADSTSSYSSPGAGAAAFVDGTYALEGGSYSIDARRDGADLVVTEPNKVSRYQSHSDGVWHFYNANADIVYGLRVVDGRTLEAFKPHQPSAAPTRLQRVGAAARSEIKVANDDTNAIAERYKQKAQDDPSNVQVWSACALAAHKRAVSPGPAADLYGMQMAQVLKEMMTDSSVSPCEDAIPAALW